MSGIGINLKRRWRAIIGLGLTPILVSAIAFIGWGINPMTDQITVRRVGFPDGYAAADVSAALTGVGYTLDAMYGESGSWIFKVSEADENDRPIIEAAIDGQVDLAGGNLPSTSRYSDHSLIRAANATGSAVTANQVGYLDEDRNFQFTETEGALVEWCVVIAGGEAGAEIVVATRGRVTLAYTGSDPVAGDYLITSTVAGRAQAQSFVSQEIFAKALAAGDPTTDAVEVLLLTQRRIAHKYGAYYLLSITGSANATALWTGTVNDAGPTSSPVTVATTGGKALSTITPGSTNELVAIVIRNTTRGNEALLASLSGSDLTFVDDTALATWQNGDSLTAVSEDVGSNMMSVQLKNTSTVPPLATGVYVDLVIAEGTVAGASVVIHPEGVAYSDLKTFGAAAPVINKAATAQGFVPLFDRQIALQVYSGSNMSLFLKLIGYIEAAP